MENGRPAYYGVHVREGERGTSHNEDAFARGYVALGWFSDLSLRSEMNTQTILDIANKEYAGKEEDPWNRKKPESKGRVVDVWRRFVSLGEGDVLVMPREEPRGVYAVGRVVGPVRGFNDDDPRPPSEKCDWKWWVPVEWCRSDECIERPRGVRHFAIASIDRIAAKTTALERTLRQRQLYRFILSTETGLGGTMMDEIEALLLQQGQIVLCGPPGTGKTYTAHRLAKKLILGDPEAKNEQFDVRRLGNLRERDPGPGGIWELVQFHPSYTYEDFVRGIQARTGQSGQVSYEVADRVFANICKAARSREARCVLVIDEINRANLASVLGELIYALEYRGHPVETPYALEEPWEGLSPRQIVVPRNLFVIGTMNTADRSVGHIDYAVRRRFAFVHCPADAAILAYQRHPARNAALALFKAVQQLFTDSDSKVSPEFSSKDVQIGHTYFMVESTEEVGARAELARKFVYQVYPILREYVKDGILRPPTGGPLSIPGLDGIVLDHEMLPTDVQQALEAWLDGRQFEKSEGNG